MKCHIMGVFIVLNLHHMPNCKVLESQREKEKFKIHRLNRLTSQKLRFDWKCFLSIYNIAYEMKGYDGNTDGSYQ